MGDDHLHRRRPGIDQRRLPRALSRRSSVSSILERLEAKRCSRASHQRNGQARPQLTSPPRHDGGGSLAILAANDRVRAQSGERKCFIIADAPGGETGCMPPGAGRHRRDSLQSQATKT